MRRSEVNTVIDQALTFLDARGVPMPAFAYWKKEDWAKLGTDGREIVDNMLGWDITDFGSGDFKNVGLLIFTFRNGNFSDPKRYPKPYAEKLLLVGDGQELPYHFHWKKMEDIINRGGGNLLVQLSGSDDRGEFTGDPVRVTLDGRSVLVPSKATLTLRPGESITLLPGQYHRLVGEKGTGPVMLFEVSSTNDDRTDNRFYSAPDRIPRIDEDAEPTHLIFNDYQKYVRF